MLNPQPSHPKDRIAAQLAALLVLALGAACLMISLLAVLDACFGRGRMVDDFGEARLMFCIPFFMAMVGVGFLLLRDDYRADERYEEWLNQDASWVDELEVYRRDRQD